MLKLEKGGSCEGTQLSAGSAIPSRSELPDVHTLTSVVRSSSHLQPFRRSVLLELGCSELVGAELCRRGGSQFWLASGAGCCSLGACVLGASCHRVLRRSCGGFAVPASRAVLISA